MRLQGSTAIVISVAQHWSVNERISNHPFEPADGSLHQSSTNVPGSLLATHAAMLGDADHAAWECSLPSRSAQPMIAVHDDHNIQSVRGDRFVDGSLIVSTVARERSERACDLVEQGLDQRAIVNTACRQLEGEDRSGLSLYTNMQLSPGSAPLGSMFLDQLLVGSTHRRPVLSTSK
jgi:hypothetical protein